MLRFSQHCLLPLIVEKSDTMTRSDTPKCHNDVSSDNLPVAWGPRVTAFKAEIPSTPKTVLQLYDIFFTYY